MVITQTSPPNITQDITTTHFTPDEYRVMEETAAERHEYCNGEIIAMAGGSEVHSLYKGAIALPPLLRLFYSANCNEYRGEPRVFQEINDQRETG